MKEFVSYLRVSTTKQGHEGLGIDAQRQMVTQQLKEADILHMEYVEVESGTKNNRPVLLKAIQHCVKNGYTLIIAKLDRLSRNAGFIHHLEDSGVSFLCCDMPEATPFTIHIYAALAQQEAKLISERTKAALAAKKRRGESLGTPANLNTAARTKAITTIKENARTNERNVQAAHVIALLREKGETLQAIANKLNSLSYKTSRNSAFTACSVQRLVQKQETPAT